MKKHVLTLSVFLLATLSLWLCQSLAEPNRPGVMLSPFAIHAEKDYGFILKGVSDQLESRFTGSSIAVIRNETSQDITATIKQAAEKSIDFAVTGSLTFFGESITITASLYEVKTGQIVFTFTKTDVDKNHLFTQIGDFADKATQKIKPPVSSGPVDIPVTSVEPSNAPKILSENMIRTQKINTEIIAMGVGNVYGDGKKTIIYIDRHNLYIGKYENNLFTPVKTIEGKNYIDNIHVSAMDVNRNGFDEIFVTSVYSKSKKVTSTVYEWNGKNFDILVPESEWFFSTGKSIESGVPVLLAQAQHFSNEIYFGPLVELSWNSVIKNYVPVKKLSLPEKHITVYGHDTGNVFNNGKTAVMTYLPGEYLGAFEINGDNSWKSSIKYGGQMKYIEPRVQDTQERYYFPARILAGEFDRKGLTSVVTIVNKNSTPSVFPNLKSLTEGHIECLTWKTLNFDTAWKTPDVSGYISDFTITDISSDRTNVLIYSVVEKEGNFFKKSSSYFVIQPILLK